MSGVSRVFNSTAGSIFLASAWAAALSSTADRLVRNCTKMGADALYMERAIGVVSFGMWGPGSLRAENPARNHLGRQGACGYGWNQPGPHPGTQCPNLR